jgi:hypothetical protein
MTLPGLRLMHQGQHEGWITKLPVQTIRGPIEKTDEEMELFARKLFKELPHPAITHGDFSMVEVQVNSAKALLGFHRKCKEKGSALVVVNLTHTMPRKQKFPPTFSTQFETTPRFGL